MEEDDGWVVSVMSICLQNHEVLCYCSDSHSPAGLLQIGLDWVNTRISIRMRVSALFSYHLIVLAPVCFLPLGYLGTQVAA